MFFFVWLFYVRYCAYQGSKRALGGFNGLMYGLVFNYLGILFILSSRRLDDEQAAKRLAEKLKLSD